jgi:hypothetical protein
VFSGCNAVYSIKPLGDEPLALISEEWEGTWIHKDGTVTVAVTDNAKGVIEVGWVEKRQGRLAFEAYPVQLLKSGKWVFGNVLDQANTGHYFWARISKDGSQLTLWAPDVAKTKALVEKAVLPGTLINDGEDVVLDELSAAHLLVVTEGVALAWERSLVFLRLTQ